MVLALNSMDIIIQSGWNLGICYPKWPVGLSFPTINGAWVGPTDLHYVMGRLAHIGLFLNPHFVIRITDHGLIWMELRASLVCYTFVSKERSYNPSYVMGDVSYKSVWHFLFTMTFHNLSHFCIFSKIKKKKKNHFCILKGPFSSFPPNILHCPFEFAGTWGWRCCIFHATPSLHWL